MEAKRHRFGRRPQLPLLQDVDQTKLSIPASPHSMRGAESFGPPRPIPHICPVGPGHRFSTCPSCRLLTAIDVITERANATDSNPVHHVAKVGRNAITPTAPGTEQFDRTLSVDSRGVLLKLRIEISLW